MSQGVTTGSVVHVKGTRVRVTAPGAHAGTWIGRELDQHGRPHGPVMDFRDTDVQPVTQEHAATLEHTSGGGGGCAASREEPGRFGQVVEQAWCQLL